MQIKRLKDERKTLEFLKNNLIHHYKTKYLI